MCGIRLDNPTAAQTSTGQLHRDRMLSSGSLIDLGERARRQVRTPGARASTQYRSSRVVVMSL